MFLKDNPSNEDKQLIDNIGTLQLLSIKGIQKEKFEEYSAECSRYYVNLCKNDISKFTMKEWEENNHAMEKLILPQPEFSFLRAPNVQRTISLSYNDRLFNGQLAFCEDMLSSKELRYLLTEDYVGNPIVNNLKYLTSHNRVNHLYHLLKYQFKTGTTLKDITRVVEWGGGYGNMAILLLRMNSSMTYTIIDTPLFSCIQWLYLVSIIGKERVNLIQNKENKVETHKINVLPLCFLENFALEADVFIATWSLSESSDYSVEYVKKRNFFNTKHLLLGYQDSNDSFPNASQIGKIATDYGAEIVNFCAGNNYAFK